VFAHLTRTLVAVVRLESLLALGSVRALKLVAAGADPRGWCVLDAYTYDAPGSEIYYFDRERARAACVYALAVQKVYYKTRPRTPAAVHAAAAAAVDVRPDQEV